MRLQRAGRHGGNERRDQGAQAVASRRAASLARTPAPTSPAAFAAFLKEDRKAAVGNMVSRGFIPPVGGLVRFVRACTGNLFWGWLKKLADTGEVSLEEVENAD